MTATGSTQPRFLPPGGGRRVSVRRFGLTLLLPSTLTDGAVSMLEMSLEPGYVSMPLHRHGREDETTYVLEGTLTVQVGEETILAPPGSCVHKPRGVFHTVWNAGARTARFLEVVSPGGLEEFYVGLDGLVPETGRPDMEAIHALARRYGLEFDMASLIDLIERRGVHLS